MSANLRERCLWLNRAIDLRKRNLPPAISEMYSRHLRDKTRPVEARIKDADAEWQTSNKDTALCRGSFYDEPLAWSLAHVMKLSAFVIYHTSKPINEDMEQTYLNWIENNPEEPRACQRGILRGKRNHCWLTRSQWLHLEFAQLPQEEWAEFARGELALRVSRGVPLVCILFPSRYFKLLAVPSFIDGGANELFCTWYDESEKVGFTWSLTTDSRGLPELVTKDTELTSEAQVVYLGTPMSPQPRPRYKRRLRRRRTNVRDGA